MSPTPPWPTSATAWAAPAGPTGKRCADWSQGVPLAKLQALCDHWRTAYDWRRCEARLNGLGSSRTVIDALGIHFLHVRSPEPDALPLVMTHGWPGSVIEFLKVIGPLTDPAAHGGDRRDAFHLVLPTLPGFGFSDKPTRPGWGIERIAGRLGHAHGPPRVRRAVGGPGRRLGRGRGGDVRGPGAAGVRRHPPEHREPQADAGGGRGRRRRGEEDPGRLGTRSSTTGPTTPASPRTCWAPDEMLDNVMMYWLPDAAASSARLYWESFRPGGPEMPPVGLPTAVSMFPREIQRASRRWAERRFLKLIHWNEPDRGGHFAALEQPERFTAEVRAGFRSMR